MLNLDDTTIYVLDFLLVIPAAWVICWLFVGLVTWKGARFTIGAPFCFIGLIWAAALILRVMGEIH